MWQYIILFTHYCGQASRTTSESWADVLYGRFNYLHGSEQVYGDENPLAIIGVLSLLCSSKGSSTTKTMSVNITEIGMHDGLHHPLLPHLELKPWARVILLCYFVQRFLTDTTYLYTFCCSARNIWFWSQSSKSSSPAGVLLSKTVWKCIQHISFVITRGLNMV